MQRVAEWFQRRTSQMPLVAGDRNVLRSGGSRTTRMRPISRHGWTLSALAVVCVASLSCRSTAPSCGRGRFEGTRPAPAGGAQRNTPPYCVSLEAEGSGGLNLRVDPTRRATASRDGGTDNTDSPPLAYVVSHPRFDQGFVEICNVPGVRRVLPNADDATALIPEPEGPRIPFPVRFYDVDAPPPYTVATNGWISLTNNAPIGPTTGGIPSTVAPNLLLAPFWRDLVTRGGVCYAVVGQSPNRRFVVQWDDAYEYSNAGAHLVFQAVIHEMAPGRAHNVVDLVYSRLDGATTEGTASGIENVDGTVGEPVPNGPLAPRVVRFTPSR